MVVVGGGVIGLSIAFHLAALEYSEVTVVERGLLGEGATAFATGGIRRQFSSRVNVELVVRSIPFWENFESITGRALDFRRHGYLFLLSQAASVAEFRRNVAMQRSLGVPVDWLEPDDVHLLVPGTRTDDLIAAVHTPDDGSASPSDAVAGYAAAARRLGVEIRQHCEFLELLRQPSGAVRGVRTDSGDLDAEAVVLAAGPQTGRVARACGVDAPISPHPRQAFATAPLPGLHGAMPLVVDMASGAYIHPERSGTAVIGGNDRDTEPTFDTTVDWSRAESLVEALGNRFPFTEDMQVVRGWCGLREMTPDDHAIVGPVEPGSGLWLAAGFSGHGFMQSPAVGEHVAAWLVSGDPGADLRALRPSRFADGSAPDRLETAVF